jgi:hypothetical protein
LRRGVSIAIAMAILVAIDGGEHTGFWKLDAEGCVEFGSADD